MGIYVVIANRTLAGAALAGQIDRILGQDAGATFRVVAPVSLPNFAAVEIGGAMGGIAVVDVDGRERALDEARQRVDELVTRLRATGAPASGEVVIGDPVPAVVALAAGGDVAEVIVSTLPSRLSRVLRQDLPQRLRRRIDVPVTLIEATDDPGAHDARPTTADRPGMTADTPPTVDAPRPADELRPAHESTPRTDPERERGTMTERVYKIIELVGTSTESWEKAAAAAVMTAQQSIRDLRVAEVVQLDLVVGDGEVTVYRAKVKVSFKYERADS
jgi:flavin-binding protein dodecin